MRWCVLTSSKESWLYAFNSFANKKSGVMSKRGVIIAAATAGCSARERRDRVWVAEENWILTREHPLIRGCYCWRRRHPSTFPSALEKARMHAKNFLRSRVGAIILFIHSSAAAKKRRRHISWAHTAGWASAPPENSHGAAEIPTSQVAALSARLDRV